MRVRAWMVLLFGVSAGAKADTMYGVSGRVDGFGGAGTLYAQSNGSTDGSYTIQQVTGPGVTGLLAPTTFHDNSNQFFPSGTAPGGLLLDGTGFAFTDTMDGVDYTVDIFAQDGSYGAYVAGSDGTDLGAVGAQFVLTDTGSTSPALRTALLRDNSVALDTDRQAFSFRFAAAAPIAATPEPASFALMGTGLLGAAAVLRKRARR